MDLFARIFGSGLFGSGKDEHAAVRPLWHAVVARARAPRLYADLGLADTVAGRFDAITLVLATVLVRMEAEHDLRALTARLTELFVDDMDGQLRESGVGDLVVGKRMGRLMSVLGGRIDAVRSGLANTDGAALTAAVERNANLTDGADPALLAAELRRLSQALAAVPADRLLAGEVPQ